MYSTIIIFFLFSFASIVTVFEGLSLREDHPAGDLKGIFYIPWGIKWIFSPPGSEGHGAWSGQNVRKGHRGPTLGFPRVAFPTHQRKPSNIWRDSTYHQLSYCLIIDLGF